MQQATPKILLIDDDPDVLEYLRVRLDGHGYDVRAACGGNAALSLCDSDPWMPDLLIVDLVMPDMTGFQVAAQLRDRYPNLNTLFMSGLMGMEYLNALGASASELPFLQKPFELAMLLERIQKLTVGESS